MRVPIFVVLLVVLTVTSVAPAGLLFWTTISFTGQTIKGLYDDRANLFFSIGTERIDPTLSPAELSREIDGLGVMIGGNVLVLDADGIVVAHTLIASGVVSPGPPE